LSLNHTYSRLVIKYLGSKRLLVPVLGEVASSVEARTRQAISSHPVTRNPLLLIASTWGRRATTVTECVDASLAAYRLPIAPAPTTTMFI